MQNVYDIAHELVRSLKETDQYKNYMSAKAKIDANESVSAMLDDLKQQSMALQTAQMMGQQPSEEDIKKVQSLQQIVMMDPLAAEFMQSELSLYQIITEIYGMIGEALDDGKK